MTNLNVATLCKTINISTMKSSRNPVKTQTTWRTKKIKIEKKKFRNCRLHNEVPRGTWKVQIQCNHLHSLKSVLQGKEVSPLLEWCWWEKVKVHYSLYIKIESRRVIGPILTSRSELNTWIFCVSPLNIRVPKSGNEYKWNGATYQW